MRNAGENIGFRTLLQTYSKLFVHAVPHPTSLREATFSPGEGIVRSAQQPAKLKSSQKAGRKAPAGRPAVSRRVIENYCLSSGINTVPHILQRQVVWLKCSLLLRRRMNTRPSSVARTTPPAGRISIKDAQQPISSNSEPKLLTSSKAKPKMNSK